MARNRDKNVGWDKLDNTALLFPVIANESMTNTYRISSIMSEDVDGTVLYQALSLVLPKFRIFKMKLRAGLFWYYFEENKRKAPPVREEAEYPGAFIDRNSNGQYMFRVSYYRKRINLEVFHAISDGYGGLLFLREIVYQYIRLRYPDRVEGAVNEISPDVFLDHEDSYIRNYIPPEGERKKYKNEQALHLEGDKFQDRELSVMHGMMPVDQLKVAAKRKGLTINKYLVGVYCYAIYKGYLNKRPSDEAINCAVPVNLRPFYDSHTLKNFFAIVTASFKPDRGDYSLDDVLDIISRCLDEQTTKENFDDIISYNVSNEKSFGLRMVPLVLKNFAIKAVYKNSSRFNTTTFTNIGNVKVDDIYRPFIKNFSCMLSMSEGQNLKGAIVSYGNTMTVTFSTVLKDTGVQKVFFQTLSAEGIDVAIQTNNMYDDV